MQGYVFFSDLESSNPSSHPPINRPGCGIEHGRTEMEGITDLVALDTILGDLGPFLIGGEEEVHATFYEVLRAAITYPDGTRPYIYGKDGIVCAVDLVTFV